MSLTVDLKRSFEILFSVSNLVHFNPKGKIEFSFTTRDIRIATTSRKVFRVLFGLSLVGMAYSLIVAAALGASICGVVFLVSLIAQARFAYLLNKKSTQVAIETTKPLLEMMSLARIDWKSMVPALKDDGQKVSYDATKSFDNLVHIFKTINKYKDLYSFNQSENDAFRALLDKCWDYALKRVDPSQYIQACFVCERLQMELFDIKCKTGHVQRVTLKFSEDKTYLIPQYLKKYLLTDDEFKECMGEGASKDDVKEIVMQGKYQDRGAFFNQFITLFFLHNNFFQINNILVKWYLDLFPSDEELFYATLSFLITFDHSLHCILMRKALCNSFKIPASCTIDDTLIQQLKETKVGSSPLDGLCLEESQLEPKTLDLLSQLSFKKVQVKKATKEVLSILNEWPSLEELYLLEPNFQRQDFGSLSAPQRNKIVELIGQELVDSYTNLPLLKVKTLKVPARGLSPVDIAWFEKMPNLETLYIQIGVSLITNTTHHALAIFQNKKPGLKLKFT